MILNANGSQLSPALLAYAWSQIPDYLRAGVAIFISPQQLAYFLEHSAISLSLLTGYPCPLGVAAPFVRHAWVQDDAVFFYRETDGRLEQLASIQNLTLPRRVAA